MPDPRIIVRSLAICVAYWPIEMEGVTVSRLTFFGYKHADILLVLRWLAHKRTLLLYLSSSSRDSHGDSAFKLFVAGNCFFSFPGVVIASSGEWLDVELSKVQNTVRST